MHAEDDWIRIRMTPGLVSPESRISSPHADWNGSRRNALIETLFGRLAVVLFEVLLATAERETSKGSFTGRAATLDVGHGVANFFGHIRTAGAGGYKLVSIIVFLWPMAMASAQCTQ
jgi:hypothetical protein